MGLPEKLKGLTGHRGGAGQSNEVRQERKAYRSLPDTELWNRLCEGDKGALGLIYDEYFSRMFNYG